LIKRGKSVKKIEYGQIFKRAKIFHQKEEPLPNLWAFKRIL